MLDRKADEAFSSEVLGRWLPEQEYETPIDLGVEMTYMCLERGLPLSVGVEGWGCGAVGL